MRKPVVDYRRLRLRNIRDPEFSHLLLLLGWVFYFIMYFLTENFIPAENCHVIYSPLDDCIPFCEFFVVPYVFWYFLIIGSLLYFALYDPDAFKKLMTYIIITQVIAMAVYIIYPSRQDLRPESFPRENIFTGIIGILYSFDTSTGVCPSLHVAYSLGIASVWLREKSASRLFKAFIVIVVILICMATVFIKQHSVVDIFAAFPVCLAAELITFRDFYRQLFRKRTRPGLKDML